MQPVTYSLKLGKSNSENYYTDVRVFTDLVLTWCSGSITPIVSDYIEYLRLYKLEEIREKEEYILELLSFGILWQSYSSIALSVKYAPFITLTKMAEWRKKHSRAKPAIDIFRGIMFTLMLLPKNRKKPQDEIPTLNEIDHVCKWFEATGEFREQALRFIRWRSFWQTKTLEENYKIFSAIHEFTEWFAEQSVLYLGKYTENVESFLENSKLKYHWREDRISCMRKRSEYHLNMVGSELMNRAFRAEYQTTETKVVLLPGCMRSKPDSECKATRVKEGLICQDCDLGCHVNQLRRSGIKYNYDVYIIPHASDLSLWAPKPGMPKRGVIASACVTTLVEGGWELKRYDVPAQCVLLDCSGCKKHWDDRGVSTSLNLRELKRIIPVSDKTSP